VQPDTPLFLPFLVTVCIESFLVTLLLIRARPARATALTVVFIHMVSHPAGAMLYYFVGAPLLAVELFVTLLEGVLYRELLELRFLHALLLSVAANTASFLLGPYIRAFITT
jgi:hypothetical protein